MFAKIDNVAADLPQFTGEIDLDDLKSITLNYGSATKSHGRLDDINEHLQMLAREFSGQPLIVYYHAWLIVHFAKEPNA